MTEAERFSPEPRFDETLQPVELSGDELAAALHSARDLGARIVENVTRVVRGKRAAVELVTTALLASGHVLIEDVPGVGKTILARSIAISIGGRFARIQGTPDLMPADVTGSVIYRREDESFVFHPGPVFSNVVLVDEINRATPRTQSALLEAMEEHQVTVEGHSYVLPEPFVLLATQNPIEYHGTYPLPEGQLDRFTLAISLGYPDGLSEKEVLRSQALGHPIDQIKAVCALEEVVDAARAVRQVHTAPAILDYVVAISQATRDHPQVAIGVSPRGSLALLHTGQARAVMAGRDYVSPDDIKAVAPAVLGHRVVLSQGSGTIGAGRAFVSEVLRQVPVPTVRGG
jgi:MoxR-like ATPase